MPPLTREDAIAVANQRYWDGYRDALEHALRLLDGHDPRGSDRIRAELKRAKKAMAEAVSTDG